MPKSKKPRRKYRPRGDFWPAAVHHTSLLVRPWVGAEWTDELKRRATIATLEPVNALQVGDLRSENWLRTKNGLELAYVLASKTDQWTELRREIIGAYRLFCHASDRHLKHQGFLAANIEAVRRALITALDIEFAFSPAEVNEANEMLKRRKYGDKLQMKLIKEAFPDLKPEQMQFHVVDDPDAVPEPA